MGEVYRARDPKLGREVAIKILPEAFAADADRLARFQREAQLLASLNHPNIGRFRQSTPDSGRCRRMEARARCGRGAAGNFSISISPAG
jgi:serine/threonine protein kinase